MSKSPRRSLPGLWVGSIAGLWVAAAWVLCFALAFFGLGPWLGLRLEGISAAYAPVPTGTALALGLATLAALALSVAWARGPRPDAEADVRGVSRRRFLARALGVGAGGVASTALAPLAHSWPWLTVTGRALGVSTPVVTPAASENWADARIRAYRRLGRTGFEISDISLGSAVIHPDRGGEALARELIERGVNYFDTAPDYAASGSEIALGRAIQGRRDQMFIATKFCTPEGHLSADASVTDYVRAVEGSLRRLQTDHVDLIHIHSCDSLDRLFSQSAHEAFDRLREQGKVRFLGVSTHTPNLETVANAAIDSGRFDVMMLAYHHGAWPTLPGIIDRAADADLGVVAMKTLKGAYHRGLLELANETQSYPQAAFRWVLANPNVSGLVISFREPAQIGEYLHASGAAPRPGDRALLERYDRAVAGVHCQAHCGACLSACPEGLPIHDVLRHRMYFEAYGEQREAMRLYAQLPVRADVCRSCSAPCTGACPQGIAIRDRALGADQLLRVPAQGGFV